ncbi:fungal-specific transcription factor domain-containing protein [Peziza echinospora]|nr:fungal-specific transcription factor domain-containing protein [Peziza echinospora]
MSESQGTPSSSSSGTPHISSAMSGRKVAIPRLSGVDGRANGFGSEQNCGSGNDAKNRVSHACEPCRQRKTKCSGERPMCRHCEEFHITCFYGQGKRDRAKSEIINLQSKIEDYEKILEQVSHRVDRATQRMIMEAIGKPIDGVKPNMTPADQGHIPLNFDSKSQQNSEAGEFEEEGTSKKPKDYIGYNHLPDGDHVSKTQKRNPPDESQVPARLTKPNANGQLSATAIKNIILRDNMTLEAPSYHLHDIDLFVIADQVDHYKLPNKDISENLVKYYFETVHAVFPILFDDLFLAQYESFYEFPFAPESSKRWLSILNLVFAISDVYSQMINGDKNGGDCDHLHYFARARLLSAAAGWGIDSADLQQIQVCGLMGMYLMATSHPTRAWNIAGLAIRYGQYLHLDQGCEEQGISETEKGMRARIWFAIRSLDQMLVVMTGRPPAIADQSIAPFLDVLSNEIPSYVSTASSPVNCNTNSLIMPYFAEYAKISSITIDTISSLYFPETMKMTWTDVQDKIMELNKALDEWRDQLPPGLDFRQMSGHEDSALKIQIRTLALQYYNTHIIINRPALVRSDGKISKLSWPVESFNHTAAATCIDAARQTIRLIFSSSHPTSAHPTSVYSTSPWWHLLHYLTLAGSVVILEISMRAEHNPSQAGELFADATQVVSWMKIMAKDSFAAHKAWSILSKLLGVAAPKIGFVFNSEVMSPPETMHNLDSSMAGDEALLPGRDSMESKTAPQISSPRLPKFDAPGHRMSQAGNTSTIATNYGDQYMQFLTDLLAEFEDNYPVPREPEYDAHSTMDSTSAMFPTPQQMYGIDVEESNSRRQSTTSTNSNPNSSSAGRPMPQHLQAQQQQQQHPQQSQQAQTSSSRPNSTYFTAAGISIDTDMSFRMFGFSASNTTNDKPQDLDGDAINRSPTTSTLSQSMQMQSLLLNSSRQAYQPREDSHRRQERGKKRKEG